MIHESLKLKISKKIIEKVCKNQLKIKKYEGDFISLRIYFNLNDEIDDHETMSEIPDEGKPVFIYENSNIIMRKSSSLIDILIVDDIEFNIDILKHLIFSLKDSCNCGNNHKDYKIHSAKSGKDAIQMILDQSSANSGYKIILMDCMMPELDGWETTKTIHNLFENKKINVLPFVVAYSAFDSEDDLNKCKNAGMVSHISKPCYKEEICQVINKWINKTPQNTLS